MAEIAKAKEEKKDDVRTGGDEKTSGRKTLMSRFRRMKGLVAGLALVTGMSLAAAQGCGSDDNGVVPLPDASLDAGPDSDTNTDGGDGGGPTDAGPDTDSGPDVDAGDLDSGLDGGETDSGTGDGGSDAGPATCSGATTGGVLGTPFYPGIPVTVGGYAITVTGESSDGVYVDIDCGSDSASVAVGFNCPEQTNVTIPVTADGMEIRIWNASSSSFVANMNVTVAVSP